MITCMEFLQKLQYIGSFVEPHISHFVNFTQCEELLPKRHFWQMWN